MVVSSSWLARCLRMLQACWKLLAIVKFIDRDAGLCGVWGTQVLPSADKIVEPLISAFEKHVYAMVQEGKSNEDVEVVRRSDGGCQSSVLEETT
ncbi:hypothetical protein B0J13DRAFT_205359 [Dactylonectria estremocensis]|uniref:Uncharacterized protein n=1 Tax=Dactylonectria estremocensis TaxID=1079267 RepID=A0A9P9IE50_9HYPO|nr:hypothetical protein B0J13DRAFT_205359 [Dactylonectria estremocensis]